MSCLIRHSAHLSRRLCADEPRHHQHRLGRDPDRPAGIAGGSGSVGKAARPATARSPRSATARRITSKTLIGEHQGICFCETDKLMPEGAQQNDPGGRAPASTERQQQDGRASISVNLAQPAAAAPPGRTSIAKPPGDRHPETGVITVRATGRQ